MARKENPNRKETPVMIEKSLKYTLSRLRNKAENKNCNESDNQVIKRVVDFFVQQNPTALHEPRSTYASNKTS